MLQQVCPHNPIKEDEIFSQKLSNYRECTNIRSGCHEVTNLAFHQIWFFMLIRTMSCLSLIVLVNSDGEKITTYLLNRYVYFSWHSWKSLSTLSQTSASLSPSTLNTRITEITATRHLMMLLWTRVVWTRGLLCSQTGCWKKGKQRTSGEETGFEKDNLQSDILVSGSLP